jgi:hypothetical protein
MGWGRREEGDASVGACVGEAPMPGPQIVRSVNGSAKRSFAVPENPIGGPGIGASAGPLARIATSRLSRRQRPEW